MVPCVPLSPNALTSRINQLVSPALPRGHVLSGLYLQVCPNRENSTGGLESMHAFASIRTPFVHVQRELNTGLCGVELSLQDRRICSDSSSEVKRITHDPLRVLVPCSKTKPSGGEWMLRIRGATYYPTPSSKVAADPKNSRIRRKG